MCRIREPEAYSGRTHCVAKPQRCAHVCGHMFKLWSAGRVSVSYNAFCQNLKLEDAVGIRGSASLSSPDWVDVD